jgi:tripartite-type tricarboxylate transporter receptor subunit TctC
MANKRFWEERHPMSRLVTIVAAALFVVMSGGAFAQGFPQRPVKFILNFGPGAGVDITARLFAEKLSARWGKPVIVENRAGGDGLVAINSFLSANDDHTLLFVPTSTFLSHPYTHEKLTYDQHRDLNPIAGVTNIVIALSAPASLPVASLREFVALARAKPDTLNVAAAAGNSEFMISGFIKTENVPVAKVPYRDIMSAPTDLSEGRIHLLMSSYASTLPLQQAGKIKILAVVGSKRVAIAPSIPTVAEEGYPNLGLEGLIGLFGPRSMPNAMREAIAADIQAVAAADPSIASRLGATGQVVDVRPSSDFANAINAQRETLASVAKALGVKAAQQP